MLVVGAIFVVRLFFLQIVQHGYYEAEALKEHVTKFTISAKRGEIYAKDGSTAIAPLVLNEPAYTVYADPRYIKDTEKTAEILRKIAGGNVLKDFEKGLGDKDRQYVVLARQLNKQQADLLKKETLSGIGLQAQDRRVYPEGQLASQLLGYVNNEGQGQYGIEQALNTSLTGKAGVLKTVTDVHGIPISVSDQDVQEPAQDGKNLVLTIDRNVQAYTEQALKAGLDKVNAAHGSAIVMNPQSGEVLAMANMPTYDPSKYGEVQDYKVFQNAVVSDPYEAGSVIKALTMASGLNEGVINPNTTYMNTGAVQVDDATIRNVLQVNGSRTMIEVLQHSLNTGVVFVLKQLGGGELNRTARNKLYDYFSNHFFFGKKTGIEQSGEVAGTLISPTEQQGNNVRYANMSFGQGMDTTVLQVASAFSAAVNGGSYYKPHLVAGYVKEDNQVERVQPTILKPDVIKQSASADLRSMLQIARAKTFHVDKPGYAIGGKTGTSQIIDPATGKYIDDNAVGTYMGFGGNSQPQYVIMIRVVDAKIGGYSGSVAAAPIFADISNWMLDYLKIQPSR
jgi:cell division protein FtsI/penicillin-binding protein 2